MKVNTVCNVGADITTGAILGKRIFQKRDGKALIPCRESRRDPPKRHLRCTMRTSWSKTAFPKQLTEHVGAYGIVEMERKGAVRFRSSQRSQFC
jgi:hypothetical protein